MDRLASAPPGDAGLLRAGFVLAGGASSRMGSDKALLEYRGKPLVLHIAGEVARAAGSVVLVGDPGRYSHLGYTVVPDVYPSGGPLAGILTALSISTATWNLIVACDMPVIESLFLESLFREAEHERAQCLVPITSDGRWQPLCAIYHTSCFGPIQTAFGQGVRKVTDGLKGLSTHHMVIDQVHYFQNVNTPEDWVAQDG